MFLRESAVRSIANPGLTHQISQGFGPVQLTGSCCAATALALAVDGRRLEFRRIEGDGGQAPAVHHGRHPGVDTLLEGQRVSRQKTRRKVSCEGTPPAKVRTVWSQSILEWA